MNLTVKQIESFETNGFLIIDNFYTKDEIANFQHTLRELITCALKKANANGHTVDPSLFENKEFTEGLLKLEEVDHFYVADLYDTLAQTTAFKRLTVKNELSVYINQLMKRAINAPLYTYTCRCRIDPPKDNRRTYGWHQEVFYSIPESRFLQTWAPLVYNASEKNGSIEVCIGSHKEGIALQKWNEEKGKATQIIVDEKITDKYKKQRIEMEVGKVLIFDYRLFHRSGDNTSDNVRYSLVGMYHDATNPSFYSANIGIDFKKKSRREYFNEKIAEFNVE